MTILHGENVIKSREKLVKLMTEAKQAGKEIERLTAKQLTPAALETALQKTSLFGTEQVVIIEELYSLPRSTKKNQLIEIASKANVEVILWEKRDLTPTMLKKFPKAIVEHYKLTNTLFAWLDAFSPTTPKKKYFTLSQQAQKADGEHTCFAMLARQVRLLIQIKDGTTPAGLPFVINKLKNQAQSFSLAQLLKIHSQLYTIDIKAKTSASFLTVGQELDLLGVNL
jgi:DNA polymerase III delta subunit